MAKITGYRTLTDEEIATINDLKALAQQVGAEVENIFDRDGVDKRWAAIARTDLQTGFMALIRAVAQPETF